GSLESQVRVQARGILAGVATLRGGLLLEEGLNVEGGRLEPGFGTGASELGTLTIAGDVTAGGRNTFAFDISSSSDRRNDSIIVEGRLTVTGTDNTILLQYAPGTLTAGTYTLLEAKGGLQATDSQFTVQGLDGIPYELQTDVRFLRITVEDPRPPAQVLWMGTVNNVWDLHTKNFLVEQDQTAFAPQDSVYLTDAAHIKTVVLSGTLPMRLVQMDAESDYTLSGDGVLSGIGGLLKNGQHTLTIEGMAHTFTGRTEVLGGTLEVAQLSMAGAPSSIGAATDEDGTVLLQNATLRVMHESTTDRPFALIGENQIDIPTKTVYANLSGAITGSGRLVKTGAGQLTLSGRNTHTGGTILRGGTILLGTYEANVDAFPSGITIEQGTLNMFGINNMSYTGPAAWDICVPAGGEAVLRLPDRFNMTGSLTGEGHLTLLIPYVRAEMAGDWSAFTGTLEIGGETGEFRLRNSKGLAGATVNLTGSAMLHYPTTAPSGEVPIGMLNGPATSSLQGASARTITWAVGGNGRDGAFEGIISNALRIVKRGAGTWALSGSNTYTEQTQVAEGRLLVLNTAGSATGTGDVSVAQGAVLGGTGTVSGAVSVAGTLQPGRDDIGTLKFGSDVTFTSTGIYAVEIRKTSSAIRCDKLQADGRVTWNGTLQLILLSGTYAAGDVLTIAAAASFSGQPTVIQPAVPADGLLWDLSDISSGIIRVVTDPAVDRIVITTQPAAPAQKLCAGASHTMQVTASGNDLRYQWYKDGSPISGAVRSSYTTAVAGVYTVRVYNANEAVFSDEVLLEVSPLKSVVLSGKYSRLTASATAPSDGYAYRWMCVRPASDAASASLRSAGWTLQEGVLSKTSVDAQCMVPASGTYRVEVTDLQSQCKVQSSATVTLTQVTGLPEDFSVYPVFYPNPVQDVLHVALPLSGASVEICDLAGNRLRFWPSLSGSQTLSVGDMPAGTYLLRIVATDGVQTGKFVKAL
ncbi:MAG: autotransporter-associated beta strand repeat-containing protein, partial [Bacteroidales bacterium]|nr:autotransporter-associated beta strand repeat-containing protein [Bacteroidales bacterium]